MTANDVRHLLTLLNLSDTQLDALCYSLFIPQVFVDVATDLHRERKK